MKASFAPRFHAMEITTSSPLPSAFDCAFGYMLGHTAAILASEQRNFYVACCAGASTHKSSPKTSRFTAFSIYFNRFSHDFGPKRRGKRRFGPVGVGGMHLPVRDWQPCAIPFTYLYPDVRPRLFVGV